MKLSKEQKKEIREARREAKREYRYGSKAMRMIVDLDPSMEFHYARYKNVKREGSIDLMICAIFLMLGFISMVFACFSSKETADLYFGIDVLFAFYWLMNYKISEREAEFIRHEFVQYANRDAIKKVCKQLDKEKKDESDKAKKMD